MATKTTTEGKPKFDTRWTQKPKMDGFDKFAKQTAKELVKMGWVARMSSNNHLLFRAPDGETTTALQHDNSAPRVRKNVESPIKAWRTKNTFKPEKDENGEWRCKICDTVKQSSMSLMVHLTSNHAQPRVCPVCERSFPTPQGYGAHLRTHKAILQPEDVPEPDEVDVPEPAKIPETPAEAIEVEVPTRELAIPQRRETAAPRGKKTPNLEKMSTDDLLDLYSDVHLEVLARFQTVEARLKLIHEAATM